MQKQTLGSGLSNVTVNFHLGGSPTDYGKHPWQASIRIKTDKIDYHLCGATIISHHHVITAAHCIEHPKELYVVR